MKNPILNLFTILLLIIALSAFIFSFIEVVVLKDPKISLIENGVLELSQIVILIGITLMYIFAVINNNANERYISLCFVAIFYLFTLRELGIKHIDVPEYLKYIFNGTGRTITAVVLLTISIIGALVNYKHYIIKTVELLFSKRGVMLWSAFVFLQVGQLMEKVDIEYTVLYEESLELIGYCLLLFCAYSTQKIPALKKHS